MSLAPCVFYLVNSFLKFLSQVPRYFEIIKNPMDLGTVKSRLSLLNPEFYKSVEQFLADVQLIFSNCAKYNDVSD